MGVSSSTAFTTEFTMCFFSASKASKAGCGKGKFEHLAKSTLRSDAVFLGRGNC
ncbi:hypothetical protein T10_8128 [Trichinella papuae]|uniref:Uncharacterized protein n=1 Tax=Trichinella papuae TaxID=268474 RepID=A0A0V1MTN8_9BILA|nr:hypothetical protein T10_8128 [Trichinella papuae]